MCCNTRLLQPLLAAAVLLLCGCPGDRAPHNSGPFGPPEQSPLLAPLAGRWTIDETATLEAWRESGVSEEVIEATRRFRAQQPVLAHLHSDLVFRGNEAVGLPPLQEEYRFFAMHEHDGKLCGKAWHHEDRYDPGDMSKCYVRLQLRDGRLFMEVRTKDGLPVLDDPDLSESLPAEGGSPATCDAEAPPGPDWSDWTMYVFARQPD